MKTVTTDLYSFNELSDDAKQTVIDKFLEGNHYDGDHVHEDCKNSLEAFCDLFNASFDYSVGPYSHSSVTISSRLDDVLLAMKGKRLIAWIVNNTDFLDRDNRTLTLPNGKTRKSKTLFEKNTKVDNCCLTGVCYDIDLVKEFIDSALKGCSLDECLDDAASELCSVWQKELEYYCTEEYAMEHLSNGEQEEKYTIEGLEF